MRESKSVIGLNMLRLWDEHQSLDPYLPELTRLIDEGCIKPVVAREFPLDEGPAAHRFLHERANVGKVVLVT
jgi:NADPH:quinone reductase-like Zn-dependent oxidoreductase